jgi:hypothetical protein
MGPVSSATSSAETWGTVSTTAFIASGVALAVGAILYLTAPSAKSPAPVVGSPGGAGSVVSW